MFMQEVANELVERANAFGQDALFEECEAIYSGMFRTQPEPAIDALDGEWCCWEEYFLDVFGVKLAEDTPVCWIVNYKGESEGDQVPLSAVEHLQVFYGKYDYR